MTIIYPSVPCEWNEFRQFHIFPLLIMSHRRFNIPAPPRHPSTRRRSQILCADPILHSEHHQVTDCLTMCSVSKLGVWERQSPVPFSAQWRIPGNCKSMIIGVFFICRNCSPSSNTALGGGQPRIRILLLLRALLNDWPVLWLAVCNVHLWFLPPSNQPHPGATHGVDEPTT